MKPAALAYEVALMWADAVIAEARRLTARDGATVEERAALLRERVRLKLSKDWFDQLVVERMELDKAHQKTEKKA